MSIDELDASEVKCVMEYMRLEASDEVITSLELHSTTVVAGRRYAIFDVKTNRERWWVITNPINLYPTNLFPSADYCLTFHLGLMLRIGALT